MTVKRKVFQASAIARGFFMAMGTDVGRKAFTEMVFPRGGGGTGNVLEPRTRLDYQREVGDGSRSSIIMGCYRWIARVFPEAPMLLVRKSPDGDVPIENHRLLELLEEPNKFYSGATMWAAIELDLLLTGNAYLLKVASESGQPAELWWAPSTIMAPKWPRDGQTYISHYEYRPNGFPIRIEPEDVIHFRDGIDPENTRLGMSPLRSLFREVFTDLEASQWTATLLRNGAVPGLIISPAPVPAGAGGEVPGSEEMSATKEYFQQEFTGDRRGRTLVMSGPTQVHQYGFNPEQMNVRGIRQIPEERICSVIGIQPAVIGLGTGLENTKVGATMKEMREEAYENTIIPLQRNISQTLESQYLPDFLSRPKEHKLVWDLSQVRVLQADQVEEAKLWDLLVKGAIATRAEAREVFNLPIEDSDKVYLMGGNILEVPQGLPAPAPRAALPPPPPETRAWDRGLPRDLNIPPWHGKSDSRQRRIMARFREDAKELEAQFVVQLGIIFDRLGQLAEDAVLAVDLTAIVTRADTNNHYEWKQDPVLDAIVNELMAVMDIPIWQQEALIPGFNDHYVRTLNATVGTVNAEMGLEVLIPDEKARAVIANGGRRAGLMDITTQTRGAIFRALEEGRAAGQGPIALARKIREHVTAGRFGVVPPGASPEEASRIIQRGINYRSEMIARTETKFAQNVSSLETYLQAEVVTGVLAFDNQTGFGDEDCTARNGTVFTFAAAEAETQLEHPNGTLNWAPVTGGTHRNPTDNN